MTAHHPSGDTTPADTPTARLDQRTAALYLATMDWAAKGGNATLAAAREIAAAGYFTAGDRLTIRHPDTGAKLGTVSMSDPDPVAEPQDERQLTEWAEEHFTGANGEPSTHVVAGPNPDRADEVLAVLTEHAPHLLTTRVALHPWARDEILAGATADRFADWDVPPPVAVRVPRGVVSVRRAKGTDDVFAAIVGAGRVDPFAELPPPAPAA